MEKQGSYQIVRKRILNLLKTNQLRAGDKLPSERNFCEETGLNRNTVRHGLLLLQREGIIFRLERKGWYVNPVRLTYNPTNHVNFAKLAASQARHASWTAVDKGIIEVNEGTDTGENEGFPLGTGVYEMDSILMLDGQKVAYTLNYLHAERLEGIIPKIQERAMTQVIEEEYKIKLKQRNLIVRPQLLAREVTTELGISFGSPGVYIRRIKIDEDNQQVLTVEHEYWRFDAIELRIDQ